MKQIMTVAGWIGPEQLGFCQCHEHLMLNKGVPYEVDRNLCIDDVSKSIEEASRLKQIGGSTVIDAQPIGCGRNTEGLARISRASGLNIIASTGFHKLIFYSGSHWLHTLPADKVADIFISEIQTGMYQDAETALPDGKLPYRAGIIKAALDRENLTPTYEKLFYAACSAAVQTDVPLMVHIEKDSDPQALLDFLLKEGVSPGRIIFCHLDRAAADLHIHKELLSQEIYLEYDTIGRYKYHSDWMEIQIIKEILRSGFESQILFSLDTTRARLKSYAPDAIGLDYLFTTFMPLMRKEGITEEQILKISHLNCIDVFTKERGLPESSLQ